ncbi:hypothetical protein [Paraburkholderia dinghuensis]|uniref:Uncharacterized protein n=1 Tax=Paraburkholderia dinghuensis TaxID=2305225 RepID=A0A3N6NBP4_9BURK|nr:hypothetical protein [Paraburkholderia dinghuensis]RQH05827.1 hypothetical protein D1Y85_14560 [Paraburkholderia dinghuensis]
MSEYVRTPGSTKPGLKRAPGNRVRLIDQLIRPLASFDAIAVFIGIGVVTRACVFTPAGNERLAPGSPVYRTTFTRAIHAV